MTFEWVFPLVIMGGLGVLFGAGLAYASKKFAVKKDPLVEQIYAALPGINCGACGYAGCAGYAEAVAKGEAAPNLCAPGGAECREKIAAILGVSVDAGEKNVAQIHCQGAPLARRDATYVGVNNCPMAHMVGGAGISCMQACLMMGECAAVCPFDAIEHSLGEIPRVDEEKCTACGKCVAACPRALITLRPLKKRIHVVCRSQDKGAIARKKCATACIACGKCVKVCPVEAIRIDNNCAIIDPAICVMCGKCVGECPTSAIRDMRQPAATEKVAAATA